MEFVFIFRCPLFQKQAAQCMDTATGFPRYNSIIEPTLLKMCYRNGRIYILLSVILAVILDKGAVDNTVYSANLFHKEGIIVLTEHLDSHFGLILTQGF